jgi:hypothetical protein
MNHPEDDELRRQVAALPDPVPSGATDARIRAMIAEAASGTSGRPPGKRRHLRAAAPLLAVAAGFLVLVFAVGWVLGNRQSDREYDELLATRTLMLELMRARDSHQRIRAATASLSLEEADPVIISQLGRMLRQDVSTNVRLAALDALLRFADQAAARDEMLAALGEAPPPAVQIQLMETLIRLNEKRVLPYLEDIIESDSLPRQLRDRAELGTFKLI